MRRSTRISCTRHAALLCGGLALCLLLGGCAAGQNVEVGRPDPQGTVAGFWKGVWHGVIAPVTFVVSLFKSDVRLYEVHNNGGWYDLGFLIGLGALHTGPVAHRRSRRGRRTDALRT